MRPTWGGLTLIAVFLIAAVVWPDPQSWLVPTAALLGIFGFDGAWARQIETRS